MSCNQYIYTYHTLSIVSLKDLRGLGIECSPVKAVAVGRLVLPLGRVFEGVVLLYIDRQHAVPFDLHMFAALFGIPILYAYTSYIGKFVH